MNRSDLSPQDQAGFALFESLDTEERSTVMSAALGAVCVITEHTESYAQAPAFVGVLAAVARLYVQGRAA